MSKRAARAFYEALPKEHIKCPLTGSGNWLPIVVGDRYHMGLETMICADSGFVATNPRPTRAALLDFYQNEYRDYYFSFPDPRDAHYQESMNRQVSLSRAEWLVDFVIDHLAPPEAATDDLRVLDVGCADGCFLVEVGQRLSGRGSQAGLFGIEPDPVYGSYAAEQAGAIVRQGGFETELDALRDAGETFDLVVLSHVLEHLCDPDEALARLAALIKPGGYLLLEVPNVLSPAWAGIDMFHIAHINHFFPETLSRLVVNTGLVTRRLFSGIHPVDAWAMTLLAQKPGPEMTVPVDTYAAEFSMTDTLYGQNRLDIVREFIRLRSGLPNRRLNSLEAQARRFSRALRAFRTTATGA